MSRPLPTEPALLRGPAGHIEALIDAPEAVKGIALVCHPHPLFGGANTNKVAHTLARAYRDLGYAVIRPNFRGVGKSEGTHDHGEGETEDMLAVISWAESRWGAKPLALGGFSFGGYVQVRVANRLADALRLSLAPLVDRIDAAFIFGSMASGTERAGSDIDLMVVGDAGFAEIVDATYEAQAALGREINPKVMSASEWQAKRSECNAFLQDVLNKPRIMLIGNADAL